MTSSIFLPQGTGGQRLTGINSSPLISRLVCCLVVSQPFRRIVRTSCHSIKELSWNMHSLAFLFLFSSLCFTVHHNLFTVQWGTLECPISRHMTLCLWQFPLSGLWCSPLPQSCVSIGALCRKILGAKVIRLSPFDTAVILNGRLYVCLGARRAIHTHTLVTKGTVNTGAQLFD